MKHCERACCQEETELSAGGRVTGGSSPPVEGAPGYESAYDPSQCEQAPLYIISILYTWKLHAVFFFFF